jgi:hypothetical protein
MKLEPNSQKVWRESEVYLALLPCSMIIIIKNSEFNHSFSTNLSIS